MELEKGYYDVYLEALYNVHTGQGGYGFFVTEHNDDNVVFKTCVPVINSTTNRTGAKALLEVAKFVEQNKKSRFDVFVKDGNLVRAYNDWMHVWATLNWRSRKGLRVKNADLWEKIYYLKKLPFRVFYFNRKHIKDVEKKRTFERLSKFIRCENGDYCCGQ